jgi:hypothetical protein
MNHRVVEFTEVTTSMAAFTATLHQLRQVDANTWLRALPSSVVQSADRGKVLQDMLTGIPLPPGFDASQIRGAGLARARYQLGAAVSGTIACEWFRIWEHGRTHGNQAEVNRAIAAMATASRWPVLRQMRREGGWTAVVLEYARDMNGGVIMGRPLLPDVNSGLGCSSEWGVRLGH